MVVMGVLLVAWQTSVRMPQVLCEFCGEKRSSFGLKNPGDDGKVVINTCRGCIPGGTYDDYTREVLNVKLANEIHIISLFSPNHIKVLNHALIW
jgi:hypothetical protein